MKPIFDNRMIVGYAKTAAQASRIARQLHQTIPAGWKVTTRLRNTELIPLPEGWVYSIHP